MSRVSEKTEKRNGTASRSAGPAARARPPMKQLPASRRMGMLKALSDPHRFALLEQIARSRCPLGCAQARAALPISAATLSHHVKELETAGLIEVRREGKFAYLSLRPGVLTALGAGLAALESGNCPGR